MPVRLHLLKVSCPVIPMNKATKRTSSPTRTWDAAIVVLCTERKYVQKWIARKKPLRAHRSPVLLLILRSSLRYRGLPSTTGIIISVTNVFRYAARTSDGDVLYLVKIEAVDVQKTANHTNAMTRDVFPFP
jgi:hypothetical protein